VVVTVRLVVVKAAVVQVVAVEGTTVVPLVTVLLYETIVVVVVEGETTVVVEYVANERQVVPEVVVVVDIVVTVMFEKVNVKVKFHKPNPRFRLVVTVVVKGPGKVACIGFSAGATAGTRAPSAPKVTQIMTRVLIASCLFKSVPSLLGDFGR
jgi:hypothetical protein